MTTASAGTAFRALLSKGVVVLPGVFSAITGLIAQRCGFEALYVSGAGVTNSMTGYPDIALLGLTEVSQQAAYIARAVNVPVIVDADTGYGDVHNVMRAVAEFERAGAAGVHIEDQVAPKRCGHLDGKQLIAPDDMARKIRAAARARSDPGFYLIARTDARGVNGLNDAIDRGNRYMDAGADAIFPESLESADEFARYADAVRAPLLANMTEYGKTPLLSVGQFRSLGYAMVMFPMSAFRVMMKAAGEAYAEVKRAGTQSALLGRMQTRAELYELIGYANYETLDKQLAS